MLIKAEKLLKPSKKIKSTYLATVIDNNDPLNIGRIKADIPGLFTIDDVIIPEPDPDLEEQIEYFAIDSMPWIYPKLPPQSGSSLNSSEFEVPEVGSNILVEFPYDDIYSPFYVGRWVNQFNLIPGAEEDSPNTKITKSGSGTTKTVNKAKGTEEEQHSSGITTKKSHDGVKSEVVPKSWKAETASGKTSISIDNESGEARLEGDTKSVLSGERSEISPSSGLDIVTGDIKESLSGSKVSDIGGGKQETIGGSSAKAILSNESTTIGGSKSETVLFSSTRIIGQGETTTVAAGEIVNRLLLGNHDIQILGAGSISRFITAGSYECQIVAGQIVLKTGIGQINLSNTLANFSLGIDGSVKIEALTQSTITALIQVIINAPIVMIGPTGSDPALGYTLNPIEDYITGKPKIPSTTVFISP